MWYDVAIPTLGNVVSSRGSCFEMPERAWHTRVHNRKLNYFSNSDMPHINFTQAPSDSVHLGIAAGMTTSSPPAFPREFARGGTQNDSGQHLSELGPEARLGNETYHQPTGYDTILRAKSGIFYP